MCTFLPPPGGPPGGAPGGAQSAPQRAPPRGGSSNTIIYIYTPRSGPKMGSRRGVPAGARRGPGGGPGGARGAPARPREISRPGGGPGGARPGGSPEGVPDQGPGAPVRGASLGPIITDPTGDALRKLHAMHRCFPPSIADMAARDRGPCPHLFGVSYQPQANVARVMRATSCGAVPTSLAPRFHRLWGP